MLDLSPEKVLVILAIALVVLGPQRLPQAARGIGRVIGEIRRMTAGLQTEMRTALAEPKQVLDSVVRDMGLDEIRSVGSDLRSAVSPFGSPLSPVSDTAGTRAGASPSDAAPLGANGSIPEPAPASVPVVELPPPPADPSLN
jgi:sec-independent protein translocase protein TatB